MGSERRYVVLQTHKQSKIYEANERRPSDIVIPLGPEAKHEADRLGWDSVALSDLWSQVDYSEASEKSHQKIDALINLLNTYSRKWDPASKLELGSYYSFQLWVIIGQIHYNLFIVQSLARKLYDSKLIVYTKNSNETFLDLRPDPDSVFANVLISSDLIHPERFEVYYIDEKRPHGNAKEKLLGFLSSAWICRLRELRLRWKVRSSGRSTKKVLLIGGDTTG